MRKLRLVIGIVVAVIVVAVVATLLLLNAGRFRGPIQAQLEQALARKVAFGTISLGFIPLRLQVHDFSIAEDPAFGKDSPFVRVERLDVRVSLSSLWRGDGKVQSLELDRPVVELIRDKQGAWNFSTLGAKSEKEASTLDEPGAAGAGVSIERLSIRDGQVAMTDLQNPRARTVYDHIDVTTQLSNQLGVLVATGNLKLNAARFNGVDIGYPIAVDYDVTSKSSEGLLTINRAAVQLGKTPVSITGSIDTAKTPARLNLSMKTGDVTIEELARLASAFGVAFAPDTTVAGRVNADVTATGPASQPALNGKISARELKISSKEVRQPVEVKAVDITLTPTEIRSNDFTATSGKTNVGARFAVRQYMEKSPSIDVAMRAHGATLPEIQSIATAYGVTGLDQIAGEGKLDLDLRAAGTVESFNSQNLRRALNGALTLDFNAVRLSGFDVAHELGVIGGFIGAKDSAKSFSDILKLTGQIVVKNGIAQTDDLRAETALGNLAATGTADLASESLNLKLAAVLSKAATEKAGGSRVAGYMRTALTNNEGELIIPALVTGTFKQPRFSPDVQTFVQMQKQKLIPGYQPGQKPVETIKGILGGILGGKK